MMSLPTKDAHSVRVALALLVAGLSTVGSLLLLGYSGSERFVPVEIAAQYESGSPTMAPGKPSTSSGEVFEEPAEPAPEPIVERVNLEQSEYLQDYLVDTGLDAVEAERWANAFRSAAYTGLLRKDHQLSLFKDPETGRIRGLQYDLDDQVAVAEAALGNGVVLATQQPIKYLTKLISDAFTLEEGFEKTAQKRHLPKTVVERLREAFSRQRLQKLSGGAAIRLIYEEQESRDGAHKLTGDVKAAQLVTATETFDAFYFRDEHGLPHFYDDSGKTLGPQFLRYPVNFQYISSGFSSARYHPILHRYRPHVGVDLVAHYGTPVKAVADGKIEFSDWDGELGRCIRIEHQDELTSLYAHLSRISPGIKPGTYVRTGQLIGWVGTSGLSTGPHLHFALFKDGAYVNPLTVKFGRGTEISSRTMPVFEKLKHQYLAMFKQIPDFGLHVASAPVPAQASLQVSAKASTKPPISQLSSLSESQLKALAAAHPVTATVADTATEAKTRAGSETPKVEAVRQVTKPVAQSAKRLVPVVANDEDVAGREDVADSEDAPADGEAGSL